ncbi:3-oxoacid CoA-transferase, subunit B [Moorella glycerini]|uniref:Butyrate--acetoacetate CoA-transferase subunit B n=1 Tax=Neomoorella stamsii TaxID=1266720 RepID=A0A9X7J3P6_9FIRM|nr:MULTISPECIES: 3-oxoacid CoA-transferase subunit B [Moorella]PRR73411.1 Butyrate--acetoacetate CoA-transferase subunit B [Moorella stamsii]CEP69180.1 3-oxoacid CoA-transferase, subunit B [Moorella glycerini]
MGNHLKVAGSERSRQEARGRIARRVALELKDGDVVNLGIGIPTLVAEYVNQDITVYFESENGIVGIGSAPPPGKEDPDLVNASGQPITILEGGACFDSATSFGLIRGGHLDVVVLGGLQVDEEGNLANWIIPGKLVPGMGGAMDLAVGAKRVIIAMEHVGPDGRPKIVKRCDLPLTAARVVNLIVTDLAVIEVTVQGLELRELWEGTSVEEVVAKTGADLRIPERIERFQ